MFSTYRHSHLLAYSVPSELVLQLLMTVDLNNSGITASDPEGVWVWIGQKELDSFPLNDPFYVIPGYHQYGKVEIIEYRRIIPTFLEALGFNPVGTHVQHSTITLIVFFHLYRYIGMNTQQKSVRLVCFHL